MTGKKRTLHNKEQGDEVETASKFSGSDTKREENADITEVDEDYCTINDRIFQACNFDYRSDQESEAAEICLFVWCLTTHQPLWVISVRRY